MKVTISSPQSFSILQQMGSELNIALIEAGRGPGGRISLTQSQENTNKVSAINGGVQVPATFGDLIDFNDQNVADKSVIMFDAATQKYVAVNVDELLSAAATEPIQPGLPEDFIVETEQSIDIDGGGF